MVRAHIQTGGRYPVLRALAILYMIGAAGALCVGIYGVFWELFAAPGDMRERGTLALQIFAVTFFGVVTILAVAELIKLLIDVEHNTRASAIATTAVANGAVAPARADIAASGDGGVHINRIAPLTVDEESAEAALLRGH